MKKPIIIFFLVLIIPLNIIFSQEIEELENNTPKAVIFLSVNLSEGEYSDYQKIITEIITVELTNMGFTITDKQLWQDIADTRGLNNFDLLIGSNAISIADAVKADLAITGFYYIEDSSIIIDFKCYSVQSGRLIASYIDSGRIGLSLHNLINNAITQMLPQIQELKEYIVQIYIEDTAKIEESSIYELTLISEDEGLEVYLAGDTYLGKIVNGRLTISTIPFIAGTELIIHKKKEGYHSDGEIILLEETGMEVILQPLAKKTRFAAEMLWTSGQFFGLGMGFRFYIKPDSFFISLDDYFYMQYGFDERSNPVFHNDLRFLAGKYLFLPYNSTFRMGISAGLGCIFTFYSIPEKYLYTDFYINFSNFWMEWNIEQWAIFLRFEGKYTVGIGRNLLERGFVALDGGFGPPITIGVIRRW